MERKKPAQDHTGLFEPPREVNLRPIGYVISPYRERFGTPRQPTVTAQVVDDHALEGEIRLFEGMGYERALKDLAGFDYVWILSWLHLNQGWRPEVMPPRGPRTRRGVFATRAPHRPNPLGLSALRVVEVGELSIRVHGLDLLDRTPVLDIKPYIPYSDAFPGARSGWIDAAGLIPDGPDALARERSAGAAGS